MDLFSFKSFTIAFSPSPLMYSSASPTDLMYSPKFGLVATPNALTPIPPNIIFVFGDFFLITEQRSIDGNTELTENTLTPIHIGLLDNIISTQRFRKSIYFSKTCKPCFLFSCMASKLISR